jgi:hypothetical protein
VRIPTDPVLRDNFYRELIDQCFASRSERIGTYDRLKAYYLFGSDRDELPIASKIYSALDTLRSYLFSAETTRFVVELGEGASLAELPKTIPIRNRLMDEWHDSGIDVDFSDALIWSLVYNSMFLYPTWRGGAVQTYVLEPHQVGVYREDKASIDRQECFAVRYQTTTTQLLTDLEGHPKLDQIMMRMFASASKNTGRELPNAVQRIITSAVSPNVTGQIPSWWANPQIAYDPKVEADMIEMFDLWVWNDAIDDYQRVTRSENEVTIFDRANTFLPAIRNSKGEIEAKGEHPLIQICPNPQYNYFWGRSEITHLLNIQDAWSHRIQQMQRLGDKIVDPPKTGFGLTIDAAEAHDALFNPHGFLNAGEQNAKLETDKIDIPAELWEEVRFYDQLFSEQMGITNIMKGLGESGVRSRGQTDTMARLGSSRAKNRAMVIEDSLDRLATKMTKLLQRHDKTHLRYQDEKGKSVSFIASEFTNNFTVKVDGHTMSPIFVEDEKNLAFSLLEAKAITRERMLEMVHPVMLQTLKADLKKIEEQEAAQAQAQQQAEQGGPPPQGGGHSDAAVAQALKELAKSIAAPRRTELVRDSSGRGVASISTPQLQAVK